MLAKAIVVNSGGLSQYINYAKRWKKKEEEWKDNFRCNSPSGKVKKITRKRTNISQEGCMLPCFLKN